MFNPFNIYWGGFVFSLIQVNCPSEYTDIYIYINMSRHSPLLIDRDISRYPKPPPWRIAAKSYVTDKQRAK